MPQCKQRTKKCGSSRNVPFAKLPQPEPCCQLADFSDPLSNFITKKRLAKTFENYSDCDGKARNLKYIKIWRMWGQHRERERRTNLKTVCIGLLQFQVVDFCFF